MYSFLFFTHVVLTWSSVIFAAADDAQQQQETYNFVMSAARGEVDNESIWTITTNDMLFVVDTQSPTNAMCGCRKDGDCSMVGVGIIGYVRPGQIARFCLWQDGLIDSFMSRRQLTVSTIEPAPSLKDLAALIDEKGPQETCVPPAHRGVLYETMELLCFCMGHKPAVVRQRQTHRSDHGLNILNGVPASLFVPHTRILLKWLLHHPDKIWRGLSKEEWQPDDSPDPPFEHSLVLARDPALGQHLVDLHVQDASVPNQETPVAMARYIAHVGNALGYSQQEVRVYLETSGVVVDVSKEDIDEALALAEGNTCEDDSTDECHLQQQQQQELSGFRDFLESQEATALSPKTLRAVVEPLDDVFLI